jgi:integrase
MTHARYRTVDATALMASVTAMGDAPGTNLGPASAATYGWRWQRSVRWWKAVLGIEPPVTERDVLRLLAASMGQRYSSVRAVAVAVAHHHRVYYGTNPCADEVAEFLKGYALLYGTMPRPVDALRPDEFNAICAAAPDVLGDFVAARLILLLTASYGAALRAGETVRLAWPHLLADDDGYGIFVARSKTDPYGRGTVAAFDLPAGVELTLPDAVDRLHRAAAACGVTLDPSGPLAASTVDATRPIDKATYRQQLVAVVQAAGITRRINTHSAQRGKATEAAKAGATYVEVMQIGRWQSVNGAAGYVDDEAAFAADLQLDYPASGSSSNNAAMLLSNLDPSSM